MTQSVTAYQLVNVVFPNPDSGNDMPIFIVDTPGFSDVKLSDAGVFIELGKAVARNEYASFVMMFSHLVTDVVG